MTLDQAVAELREVRRRACGGAVSVWDLDRLDRVIAELSSPEPFSSPADPPRSPSPSGSGSGR